VGENAVAIVDGCFALSCWGNTNNAEPLVWREKLTPLGILQLVQISLHVDITSLH